MLKWTCFADDHICTYFHNIPLMICLFRYSPEDQRFKELLSLFDRLNRDFADGLLADFIPVLRYLPSKQVTELKGNADYFSQFLLGTVREHKQSFDSSEYVRTCRCSISIHQ